MDTTIKFSKAIELLKDFENEYIYIGSNGRYDYFENINNKRKIIFQNKFEDSETPKTPEEKAKKTLEDFPDKYMYMYQEDGLDYFKHIGTRRHIFIQILENYDI